VFLESQGHFILRAYVLECVDFIAEPFCIIQIDQVIRNYFGLNIRGGEMIQPWYSNKRDSKNNKKIEEIIIEFEFYIDEIPGNISLACETPWEFRISINESNVDSSKIKDWWCDKCIKMLPINKSLLKMGKNVLTLKFNYRKDINIEAVYLLGSFGVKVNGINKTLVKLNSNLQIGDISLQGLPFYGASISYKLGKLNLQCKNDEQIFLKIDDFSGACIKVISDNICKIIAFPPYEVDITDIVRTNGSIELELILTRRNTLGPLHQNPVNTGGVGPDNFITTGDFFNSNEYGLIPQGILGEIKLVLKSIC